MKYIKTDWDNPYYNMAFERYIMENDNFDDDYVFFYIHKPSVIIGKHQNTHEEINKEYTEKNNIIIARRNTGGGSVYHDSGNLNFSFIFKKREDEKIDFVKFTNPVINALKKLGIDAYLSGRNDILLNEKKISGNAQWMNSKKILHHGTLLYDVNIEALVNALNVSNLKIESKAIKSVKSRVINIKDYLKNPLTIFEFRDFLLGTFFKDLEMEEYILTKEDLDATQKLVDETFSTWEHNFGNSPKFKIKNEKKYKAGIIKANINVKEGKVIDMAIYGDYFSKKETSELIKKLIGIKYEKSAFIDALKDVNLNDYILNLDLSEFLNLIF